MNRSSSQKAAITVSLSWIFMGIVGTFFIVLAYNIIDVYQENEEAKYNLELKQTLRTIFNNVGRTAGIEDSSLEPLGNIFKNKEVEILCVDNLPILSLDGELDASNQFIQLYPTFMTYIKQSPVDTTYLAVESMRLPFKITSMLALVSTKNVIVFDSKSEISEELIDKFSKSSYRELNYLVKDFDALDLLPEELRRMNLNSVMFVSDADRVMRGLAIEELSVNAYHLRVDGPDEEGIGTLLYENQEGERTQYPFIDYNEDLSIVTMATLSSPQTFECSYNRILDSIVPTYTFYIEKTQVLEEQALREQICSSNLIVGANATFDGSQQQLLYQNFKNVLIDLQNHFKNEKFNNLEESISLLLSLTLEQEQLERFNCEYVY